MSNVTLQFRSLITGDDGYWTPTTFYNATSTAKSGKGATEALHSFFLYKNIIIPKGATIVAAYIRRFAYAAGAPILKVFANDTTVPVAPTNVSEAETLALSSGVAWNYGGTHPDSPDISTLIQGIIDKANWDIGKNLMLLVKDDGSAINNYIETYTVDSGSANRPCLEVTWTLPANWILKNAGVSGDDGYRYYNQWHSNETTVGLGSGAPGDQMYDYNGFFRFPSVAIPQGRTINHAYLVTVCQAAATYINRLKVFFNAADNAVAPTGISDYDTKALTVVTDGWDGDFALAGRIYRSPDLKTSLQAVIDRALWAENNALMVLVKDDDGTNGAPAYVYAYDNGSNYPLLLINAVVPAPNISSFDPITGPVGTPVVISGTAFDPTPANNTVTFNGTVATVISSTTTEIVTSVPAGATTGLISVETVNGTGVSGVSFTVTPSPPTITSFTPTSGRIGATVTITGTGFSTTPANNIVKFHGADAVVVSSTIVQIVVTVPEGATTGPISVETVWGTAISGNWFMVSLYGITNAGLLRILPQSVGHIDLTGSSPQYWFQWGQYIVIEPVPDITYLLTLFVSDYPETELTLTTDFPDGLPDEFHSCAVDYACYVLALRMKKWKKAAKYYNLYVKNLKQRKKDYMDRRADRQKLHSMPDRVIYPARPRQENQSLLE